MVLLTSSSISVAISSGVVCMFTFLLFLSGYVLQQQTVRSLQEALHAPPVPKPIPTLPVRFQNVETEDDNLAQVAAEVLGTGGEDKTEAGHEAIKAFFNASKSDIVVQNFETPSSVTEDVVVDGNNPTSDSPTESQASESVTTHKEQVDGIAPEQLEKMPQSETPKATIASSSLISTELPDPSNPTSAPEKPLRLAYILTLSLPSQICSALLFFKHQSSSGSTITSRVVLYPSTWEQDPSNDAYTNALALMRIAQDDYGIIYHPVRTADAWEGISIESQLLGELQRYHWDYDRMMYLKTPGLAVDMAALDSTLTKSSLIRNWMPLKQDARADPPILLLSAKEGILAPRGATRRLTAEAATSHTNHHAGEMDVEAAAKMAAYVYFAEGELEHRKTEKEWYGGVFERFERERAEVCKGVSFEGEKIELRKMKKSRRGKV